MNIKRSHNHTKSSSKIAIITISFKNLSELEATLQSIDHQTTPPSDNVIVASGYNDHEKKYLTHAYNSSFRRFIFDRDKSLYDAMNIGLRAADGDALLFLNSGDLFFSENSINVIQKNYSPNFCVQFGTAQRYKNEIYIRDPQALKNKCSQLTGHQGFVAPLPGAKKYTFNSQQNPISADKDWMLRILKDTSKKSADDIITIFNLGGISNAPSLKTLRLRYQDGGVPSFSKELIKLPLFSVFGKKYSYRLLYRKKYRREKFKK